MNIMGVSMNKIPTYFNKDNYEILKFDEEFLKNKFSKIIIVDKTENTNSDNFFEIHYFGEIILDTMIRGIFNEKNSKTLPCKIVAKSIKTKEEILLFDQAKHGYNSLFCDKFDLESLENRPLSKLEIPDSKIVIDFGYDINYEEEKEDYELDANNCVETINDEIMDWDSVKRNGFDYIRILATDKEGTDRMICELELA